MSSHAEKRVSSSCSCALQKVNSPGENGSLCTTEQNFKDLGGEENRVFRLLFYVYSVKTHEGSCGGKQWDASACWEHKGQGGRSGDPSSRLLGAGPAGGPSRLLTRVMEHEQEASSAREEARFTPAQLPAPKAQDARLPLPAGAGRRARGAKAKDGRWATAPGSTSRCGAGGAGFPGGEHSQVLSTRNPKKSANAMERFPWGHSSGAKWKDRRDPTTSQDISPQVLIPG